MVWWVSGVVGEWCGGWVGEQCGGWGGVVGYLGLLYYWCSWCMCIHKHGIQCVHLSLLCVYVRTCVGVVIR